MAEIDIENTDGNKLIDIQNNIHGILGKILTKNQYNLYTLSLEIERGLTIREEC